MGVVAHPTHKFIGRLSTDINQYLCTEWIRSMHLSIEKNVSTLFLIMIHFTFGIDALSQLMHAHWEEGRHESLSVEYLAKLKWYNSNKSRCVIVFMIGPFCPRGKSMRNSRDLLSWDLAKSRRREIASSRFCDILRYQLQWVSVTESRPLSYLTIIPWSVPEPHQSPAN